MKPNADSRARSARRNGKLGGRPPGEPTKLVRIYSADAPALAALGTTSAEAIRALLAR
jgi:hypothetical protein